MTVPLGVYLHVPSITVRNWIFWMSFYEFLEWVRPLRPNPCKTWWWLKGVGGVKIFVSDFFHTSLMKTTGYSKNKMGSTTSQLRTGQFLWTLKVGHYAQKIARKWPKTAKNSEKRPFFKNFKMLRLFTTLSNSLALWQITRPQGYKQNLFFRFLIFFRFWVFSGYF